MKCPKCKKQIKPARIYYTENMGSFEQSVVCDKCGLKHNTLNDIEDLNEKRKKYKEI